MEKTKASPLDPHTFASSIRRDPEFLRSLPRVPAHELNQDEFRGQRQRALARGALSIADRLQKERGDYDLNANLYRLVGQLGEFQDDSYAVADLLDKYEYAGAMPPNEKTRYYESKTKLTEFNHTLREVINAGSTKFNFKQLLGFMTNMYVATGHTDNVSDFENNVAITLIGMRNEIAFEQLLIAGGYDYTVGTVEQDSKGGDFIIEGVPVDVKASEASAERANERARENGYYNDKIIWSHITSQDYDGQLALPYEKIDGILARLRPQLDRMIGHHAEQPV